MPDKIYDYTAAGLPVVNSLRGEVSDVIREKRIGLQYDAGNSRDLLEALEKLANDDPLRGEMARNSYDAGMLYDRHVQYAKLVEIVEKVCAGKSVDATATR
jgi:glycosyltransferase involved in cell wall biosynthesis